MKVTEAGRTQQAFKLKGTAPALTLLYMLTEDLDAVEKQLSDHLRQMPQFFLYAPIVVDLTELGNARADLGRLAELLRRHNLVPVAVRNPTDAQQVQAVSAGWAILQSGLTPARRPPAGRLEVEATPAAEGRAASARGPNARESVAREPGARESGVPRPPEALAPSEADAAPELAEPFETALPGLTVRTPVRSGQVIHAVGGDLVVLGPVSPGAELIADGNIHVYGPLRGRALAGARGNSDVGIFCLSLEAEFLSIAGRYLMADEVSKIVRGKPARAYLEDETLVITPL
jgi:septum site-determining protein MinC